MVITYLFRVFGKENIISDIADNISELACE
jgi:hypothetical protein